MMSAQDYAIGDSTQMRMPAHGRGLEECGIDFLTHAFRAFGTIAADNKVTQIRRLERCAGGSTGEKLFLSVTYAHSNETLHQDLFAKFSRDFADLVRDQRGKYELEGEVRFAETSRSATFPVRVPKVYFADYEAATQTGLLITERIPFGVGMVEPQHGKCMDHLLDEPVRHYRVILRALAQVAAAHRSGRIGGDIDRAFPYDPAAAAQPLRVTTDERTLREQIASNAAFVARHPQLYPSDLDFDRLFATLDASTARLCKAPDLLGKFLTHNRRLVALCHWNANIDNCWFWRDPDGALQCGLMDWGHAGQLNLAFSLWGCLSGASRPMWNEHLEELIGIFVGELEEKGGPVIDPAELTRDLLLYAFLMYLSYFIHTPSRMLERLPELGTASSPLDPMILGADTVRNQLLISTNFFNLLNLLDLDQALDCAFDLALR